MKVAPVWFALLWCAVVPARAQAAPRSAHPGDSRLIAGGGVGGLPGGRGAVQSSVGGAARTAGSTGVLLFLGYERRLVERVSLTATISNLNWLDSAAQDAGYRNRRTDLGVAPHLHPFAIPDLGIFKAEFYLTVPMGLTFPSIRPPPRRAFIEDSDGRRGWYVGGGLGGALVATHFGVFFEGDYLRHVSGIQSVFTARDGSFAPVVQHTEQVDYGLYFNVGGIFAF